MSWADADQWRCPDDEPPPDLDEPVDDIDDRAEAGYYDPDVGDMAYSTEVRYGVGDLPAGGVVVRREPHGPDGLQYIVFDPNTADVRFRVIPRDQLEHHAVAKGLTAGRADDSALKRWIRRLCSHVSHVNPNKPRAPSQEFTADHAMCVQSAWRLTCVLMAREGQPT